MRRMFLETEAASPIHYGYKVKKILYRGKSRFQKILIFDSPHHGRVMALDKIVQITTREEVFYHECLVHPVMEAHPNPQRALVIGGGDGGTLTQLVKYPSLERIVQAELDEKVVLLSQKYFPKVARGYKDPRVEVFFTDGYKFLKSTKEKFDVIIVDLTDPIGPAKALFEEPFYELCSERLARNGFFSAQTESLHNESRLVKRIYYALSRSFRFVDWVIMPLSMYPGNWWVFSVGGISLDPKLLRNESRPSTRYYLPDVHSWYFMPNPLQKKLLETLP